MKKTPALDFPVWDANLPPAPPMTPEQYDRFLEETLLRDGAASGMQSAPVAARFVLLKEDRPVKNESSGTQR